MTRKRQKQSLFLVICFEFLAFSDQNIHVIYCFIVNKDEGNNYNKTFHKTNRDFLFDLRYPSNCLPGRFRCQILKQCHLAKKKLFFLFFSLLHLAN